MPAESSALTVHVGMGEQSNPLGELVVYQREFDEAVKAGLLSQEGWKQLYGILASINSPNRDTSEALWKQPRDLAVISYWSLHFENYVESIQRSVKKRLPEAEIEARKWLIANGVLKPSQTQVNNQMANDKYVEKVQDQLLTLHRLHSMIEALEKVISKRGSHVEQISNNERLRQRIDHQAHV